MTVSCNVTAIVLNYRSAADTKRLLSELEEHPIDVIAVDNSSNSELSKWCGERGIDYHETGENCGYAGGNNAGIRAVRDETDYFLVLNPDTSIVDETFVGTLVETMERHPNIGALSPTIVSADGEEIYNLTSTFSKIIRVCSLIPPLSECDKPHVRTVDYLPGCAMLLRAEVVDEVGFLEEQFFLYFEEVEYCTRIRQHGYDVAITSATRIQHDDRDGSLLLDCPYQVYYNTRNRFLFAKLRFDGVAQAVVLILVLILALSSAFRAVRDGHAELTYPHALGVFDGLIGRYGRQRYLTNK